MATIEDILNRMQYTYGDMVRIINSDYPGTSFSNWYTRMASFQNCNFSGSNFNDASLHDTIFRSCNLSNCKFINISKQGLQGGVTFSDCNLTNSHIKWVENIDDTDELVFENCNLDKCNFRDSYMFNVDFKKNYGKPDFTSTTAFLSRYTIPQAFWLYKHGATTVGHVNYKNTLKYIPYHARILKMLATCTKKLLK